MVIKKIKVLLVNTYDKGGAAKACIRLHEGLLAKNVTSNLLFKAKQEIIPNSLQFKSRNKKKSIFLRIKLKIKRLLLELNLLEVKPQVNESFFKERNSRLELFSFPNSNLDITESKLYKEADIINLHWVAGFVDYESFFKKNKKPVIWTLHDMNPFTGGEHFVEENLGIDNKGKPIKRILTDLEKETFSKGLDLKMKSLKNVYNLHIVVLCKWMYKEVKKSKLFYDFPVHLIPNGINTNVFKPRDKVYSKNIFNLPSEKKIILFVADSINNNRKGFIFLKKVFEQLNTNDLILCTVGQKSVDFNSEKAVIHLGNINDERLMSIAYSLADVFVIPSLMDNLPNTVLESLSCGTPVIGFPTGGINDLIVHGENGLLTKEVSVDSLLETINLFLNSICNFDRNTIREKALNNYSQNIQANKYIKLFETILKN